jgi:hypothetical protein
MSSGVRVTVGICTVPTACCLVRSPRRSARRGRVHRGMVEQFGYGHTIGVGIAPIVGDRATATE